jgi:hypothetical protein
MLIILMTTRENQGISWDKNEMRMNERQLF